MQRDGVFRGGCMTFNARLRRIWARGARVFRWVVLIHFAVAVLQVSVAWNGAWTETGPAWIVVLYYFDYPACRFLLSIIPGAWINPSVISKISIISSRLILGTLQ